MLRAGGDPAWADGVRDRLHALRDPFELRLLDDAGLGEHLLTDAELEDVEADRTAFYNQLMAERDRLAAAPPAAAALEALADRIAAQIATWTARYNG